MKIFLSMPITGFEDIAPQLARNRKAAIENILFPDRKDVEVITPYSFPHKDMNNVASSMGECIEVLLGCDAVYFADGYENSKGCTLEHAAAKTYHIPIHYLSDEMTNKFSHGVTKKEFLELIKDFSDDAKIIVECCDVSRMKYNEKDNTIRID